MDNEIEIIYNNKSEKIIKFFSESSNRFNERIKFIRILEKENIVWKEAHKYSKIWYNITYNKLKYNQESYIKIMNFIKIMKN
jgi:hypothetical protein